MHKHAHTHTSTHLLPNSGSRPSEGGEGGGSNPKIGFFAVARSVANRTPLFFSALLRGFCCGAGGGGKACEGTDLAHCGGLGGPASLARLPRTGTEGARLIDSRSLLEFIK